MNKETIRGLKVVLEEDDNWLEWNDGKFVALSSDGDLLGVEESFEELLLDSLVTYTSREKNETVVFVRIESGALVNVPYPFCPVEEH